ncbi:RUNDC1 [Cordylochernes scorpioides]|uniref:RUNDC1 n=1 Tax=Cordylochernes scorpioides TaxID=51811 RepID=A0ABY6LGC9_9ARAC|nr:RUNDC1 [Cordylochernes scorpioides]
MMQEVSIEDGDEWELSNDQCEGEQPDWEYSPSRSGDEKEETERLKKLEEEQEQLNASLIALTSHFAQVQFRLKQIVESPQEEKEKLLKELEEFAFRGIPDIRSIEDLEREPQNIIEVDHEEKLAKQRTQQKELIAKLKDQLEDLEKYAYETGEAGLPQSMVLERQSVIIEQIKGRIPLPLDQLHSCSPEELRSQVDQALKQIIYPARMKEQLVSQLKTQITDLERFIQFLQGDGTNNCTCNCPKHGKNTSKGLELHKATCKSSKGTFNYPKLIKDESHSLLQRVSTLMHMLTISFGCGSQVVFQRNILKKSPLGTHWGDLRAQLEVALSHVIELASSQEPPCEDSDYTSDSEDMPIIQCNEKLTTAVRKELCTALRNLLEHGLGATGKSSSLKTFSELQFGDCRSHTPLKRSPDSHFKAFVCAALNQKKLVSWLRMILRNRHLVEMCYQEWSYVIRTVDLAVRFRQ